jgi:hypothetical protein
MSQVPDWNAQGPGQPTPWPPYGQPYQQAPPYGQVNPQGMMMPAPGYGPPAAAPIPAGLYFTTCPASSFPTGPNSLRSAAGLDRISSPWCSSSSRWASAT